MTRFRWAIPPVIVAVGSLVTSIAKGDDAFPEKVRAVQWAQKLSIWRTWYTPGSKDPAQTREAARELIEAIEDRAAIPAIIDLLKTEEHSQYRRAVIRPLIKLGGKDAVATLVKLSVQDRNPVLRQEAAAGLVGKEESPEFLDQYIQYLYKPQFATAAAQSLRLTGLAVKPVSGPLNPKLSKGLIAALVQKQKKLVPYWIAMDSGWLPSGGRFTEYKEGWTEVLVPVSNPEVLKTLKEYSGQDYEFDQSTWSEKLGLRNRR